MLLSFHFNSGTETAITSWVDKINDDTIAHLGTLRLDTKIWTTGAFHPVHGAFVVRLCGRKQRPGREPDVLVDWPPGYGKIAGPKVLSVVEALPLRSDGSRVLNRVSELAGFMWKRTNKDYLPFVTTCTEVYCADQSALQAALLQILHIAQQFQRDYMRR